MQSLRTRPSSSDSRYLMPPQARFDDCWLVKPGEVAAVDERHARAPRREARGRDRAVDAAADDEHVERSSLRRRTTLASRRLDIVETDIA